MVVVIHVGVADLARAELRKLLRRDFVDLFLSGNLFVMKYAVREKHLRTQNFMLRRVHGNARLHDTDEQLLPRPEFIIAVKLYAHGASRVRPDHQLLAEHRQAVNTCRVGNDKKDQTFLLHNRVAHVHRLQMPLADLLAHAQQRRELQLAVRPHVIRFHTHGKGVLPDLFLCVFHFPQHFLFKWKSRARLIGPALSLLFSRSQMAFGRLAARKKSLRSFSRSADGFRAARCSEKSASLFFSFADGFRAAHRTEKDASLFFSP